jgi:predicted ester cyclase
MTAQENEALVRRLFEEVWAKGNVAAVDEFMAADYVEHSEHAVPPGSRPGRDSVKQRIALYYEAFPDWKVTLHDIFGRGDRVAYRWSGGGTHLGEWAGLSPTGLHMTTGGITILRIAGGRFVEGWASIDISRSEEERRSWLQDGGASRGRDGERPATRRDRPRSLHEGARSEQAAGHDRPPLSRNVTIEVGSVDLSHARERTKPSQLSTLQNRLLELW